MENFDEMILEVAKEHDELRHDLQKAQEQTLRIAVHFPQCWAEHGARLKSLELEKRDTFKYLQELCEDICLKDIHHLIKS